MKNRTSRFESCILVCTHGKKGDSSRCAGRGALKVYQKLKKAMKGSDRRQSCRVVKTACLGQCSNGPNLMAFPDGEVFSQVKPKDVEQVLARA